MSIRRSGRFLFVTGAVFCLAVGMLMAGGLALGATAPTTRPASAPTLAQIDWRKGFTLHQPRKYAVLFQTRVLRRRDRWPQFFFTARGILTVTLTDRKMEGSGLFTCQVEVGEGTVEGKSIPPPPASRFSFSTSPSGEIRIDRQALKRMLDPAGKEGASAMIAQFIASGTQFICYPLPPDSAQKRDDALQWKGNLFIDPMNLNWRAAGSDGLFHVEGQFTHRDTEWRTFESWHDGITLFENHLLYGTSEGIFLLHGELSALFRTEVYPLPPQTHPTTNPATSPTPPSER